MFDIRSMLFVGLFLGIMTGIVNLLYESIVARYGLVCLIVICMFVMRKKIIEMILNIRNRESVER